MDVKTREIIKSEFKDILLNPDLLTKESLEELYGIVADSMDYLDALVNVLKYDWVSTSSLEYFVREGISNASNESELLIYHKLKSEFDLDIDFESLVDGFVPPTSEIEDPVYGLVALSDKNRDLLNRACQEDQELMSILINEAIDSYFSVIIPAKRDFLEGKRKGEQ